MQIQMLSTLSNKCSDGTPTKESLQLKYSNIPSSPRSNSLKHSPTPLRNNNSNKTSHKRKYNNDLRRIHLIPVTPRTKTTISHQRTSLLYSINRKVTTLTHRSNSDTTTQLTLTLTLTPSMLKVTMT